MQRQLTVALLDARTGETVTTAVVVTVRDASGGLSSSTRDASGKAENVFPTASGLVSFAISPDAALPVRLKIVASGDGYNAGSADVTIDRDGALSSEVRLTNVNAPPAGVSVRQIAVAGTVDESGATAAPIAIATPPDAHVGQVLVTVPAATTVRTAEGALLSGTLQATVTYYSNSEPASLAAFPGGLQVTVPTADGGPRQDGMFLSGGFAAVQITDDKGNVAAQFDKPVQVSVTVPATTVNPDTGAPVRAGDVIPFWSYDERTGLWSPEGSVTLEPDGNGNFRGVRSVTHFSYFNCDWFAQPCATASTIQIVGNPAKLPLELEIKASGGGYYVRKRLDGPDPNTISLANAGFPTGSSVTLTALFQGQPVGTLTVGSLCNGATLSLPVTLPQVEPATLDAKVVRVCAEDRTKKSPLASANVMLTNTGTGSLPTFATTGEDGVASFSSLVSGIAYDVSYSAVGGDAVKTTLKLVPGANTAEFPLEVKCAIEGGPAPAGDRAPVITSLFVPRRILAPGEFASVSVAAIDPDGDPLTYGWSASCTGTAVVSLTNASSVSTDLWAVSGAGTCTVTVAASANGQSATRSAVVDVVVPDGQIDLVSVFVRQPVIGSVTLGTPVLCTVGRSDTNATCRGRARPGGAVNGGFTFDAFAGPPTTAARVTDSCGGSASAVVVDPASGTGTFLWTPPTNPGVCVVSIKLNRDSLSDVFPVAVFVSSGN